MNATTAMTTADCRMRRRTKASTGPAKSVVQYWSRHPSILALQAGRPAPHLAATRDGRSQDAALSAEPCQPRHPDLSRHDPAGILPHPDRAGRSDRNHGRRARHRRHETRGAAQGIWPRPAGDRPVRHLHRPRAARRPWQIDDHAGARAARVRHAVPGDDRARRLRDRVRARHRHSRRNDRRGAPQLRVRPWRDGRVAHRLFDADLLVGAPADPAVLGAAGLDAGVGPHRRQVRHRAGDGLPHDRRSAWPATRRLSSPRCRISSCR